MIYVYLVRQINLLLQFYPQSPWVINTSLISATQISKVIKR